ncbi:hypothetical protein C8F04DRAFT_961759 [Mycena alexandri]|uniref:Uncharacterized protein n=1 Tax=Mycena alexandri TaxID=1745969 RepID=A0AAD6SMH8_9AGAR|nr:hypothetical protein C8F04DRAFT_961759 [Mycena alexandri]
MASLEDHANANANANPASTANAQVDRKPLILPPGTSIPPGVHEGGAEGGAARVICEACGCGVALREEGGGFTTRYWEAHRASWWLVYAPAHAAAYPATTAHSTSTSIAEGPPAKRRRAKRTEEERIEYLRADAHVAQFEAYRVLCASCDKWIRLRPNSTYCSIPWDAHRKSCLAKKSNAKNVYALEERNAMFTKDPDVRKFDSERILCGMCDKWLSTPTDDHLGAVQVWVQHRAACQKTPASPTARPPHPHSTPSAAWPAHPTPIPDANANANPPPPPPPRTPTHLPLPDAPHLLLDLSPANYAAPHESRRRNAEQRAATLRADVLIREVEPNRVFCSLCTKWVQLRQDSSYCAYPWLQHRGKCLARYQRRAQKASEVASSAKGRRPTAGAHTEHRASEDGDEPESEEEWAAAQREREREQQMQMQQRDRERDREQQGQGQGPQGDGDLDAEGEADDVDADGDSYMEDDVGGGGRAFIFASVDYLFRTTYESSDDMSVSALLTYLNAAMPTDKHEDFDTGEVVRGVSALASPAREQGRAPGRYVLEGDMLRMLHESG